MPKTPKPDLSEHEDEAVPLDDVLRTLLKAKPIPKDAKSPKPREEEK